MGLDHEYTVPHLYEHFVPSSIGGRAGLGGRAPKGPAAVVSTGCTSGLDAVGHAAELIQEGSADVVIAGATDAPDLADHRGLLRRDQGDHPAQRRPGARLPPVRPTRRNGFVLGEGAAVFVLEELEHARRAARTSTPRSPASPPAATPTT